MSRIAGEMTLVGAGWPQLRTGGQEGDGTYGGVVGEWVEEYYRVGGLLYRRVEL